MPKKTEEGQQYIDAVTEAIKSQGTIKDLYKAIYGVEGTKNEVQRLTNRLNAGRSNPGADLLGLAVENLPELHDMTVAEFFGVKRPEQQ